MPKHDIWTYEHISDVSGPLLLTVVRGAKRPLASVEFIAIECCKNGKNPKRVDHITFFDDSTVIREYSPYLA